MPRRLLLLMCAIGAVLAAPAPAAAATCASGGPAAGPYTATVCFASPADGASLTGDGIVTGTITFTGTSPGVRRMVFYLDGEYLLTDFSAPYTFTLKSPRFVDGPRTLEVEALMRDDFVTPRASVGVLFSNGVLTPPVNTRTFEIKAGNPVGPGEAFVLAAAGDGAGGEAGGAAVVSLIKEWNPNMFAYLGDVYEKGTITEFDNWYRPTGFFGDLDPITNPTVGNHEYTGLEAPGYFDYWDNIPHYYSYDVNGWHVMSIDSTGQFGQTTAGTAQFDWLASELASNTRPCTLVYFHHPLYNIGQEGSTPRLSEIWSLLAAHGVDIALTAHDHTYQRWIPLDGAGSPSPTGVTQFIAGTGGHAAGSFPSSDSRVAAQSPQFGSMRLDLNSHGAAYQFVTVGHAMLDSGSLSCDPGRADGGAPASVQSLSGSAATASEIKLSWRAPADDVGVTGYEVYRDGGLLATIGAETFYSDRTVDPGGSYTYELRARDAAGNVSAAGNAVTIATPAVGFLFADGFETGDLSGWTSATGVVAQQEHAFSGGWAARGTSSGTAAFASKTLAAPETELYYQLRFKTLSQGANSVVLARFRSALNAALATVSLSATGRVVVRNDTNATTTTSATAATAAVWHALQVHLRVDPGGGIGQLEVWLDGVRVDDVARAEPFGSAPIAKVELLDSAAGRTFDVVADDVAVDRVPLRDSAPPSPPSGLTASSTSGLVANLSWTASVDDVGVAAYDVYRDGGKIATVTATTYVDAGVEPHQTYAYHVLARDAAGNVSEASSLVTVTTPAVFADDFESGGLAKWTSSSNVGAQGVDVAHGAWAAEAANTGAGAFAMWRLPVGASDLYYRVRLKVVSRDANPVNLIRFRTANGAALLTALASTTGNVGYRNDVAAVSRTSSRPIADGNWHELQVHLRIQGAEGQAEVWLDGVRIDVLANVENVGNEPIGRIEIGDSAARVHVVRFDDVLLEKSLVFDSSAPTTPTGVTAAAGSDGVTVGWTASTDDVAVAGYSVYRDGALLATVLAPATSYLDSTAQPGTYAYTVAAFDEAGNASGESAPPAVVTIADLAPPTAPADLTATVVSGHQVDLAWSAATDNVAVTGYRVLRNGVEIAALGAADLSYSDTAAPDGVSLTYAVTAVDAAGNVSPPSPTASVTTPDVTPPSSPGGVTATAPTASHVDVRWLAPTDNVGVAGYRVFRGDTLLATLGAGATSYGDDGLALDTLLTYAVEAFDAAENTSARVSVTVRTPIFGDGFESGNLSAWSSSTGLAVQSAQRFTGSFGARGNVTNARAFADRTLPSTRTDVWVRTRLKPLGNKSQYTVLSVLTSAGTPIVELFLESNRRVGYRNAVLNQNRTSNAHASPNTWHDLRVHVTINGASSRVEVWLNGTAVASLTRADSLGTNPVGVVRIGDNATNHTFDVAFDDVAVTSTP